MSGSIFKYDSNFKYGNRDYSDQKCCIKKEVKVSKNQSVRTSYPSYYVENRSFTPHVADTFASVSRRGFRLADKARESATRSKWA